jgi:hypothetical protein
VVQMNPRIFGLMIMARKVGGGLRGVEDFP